MPLWVILWRIRGSCCEKTFHISCCFFFPLGYKMQGIKLEADFSSKTHLEFHQFYWLPVTSFGVWLQGDVQTRCRHCTVINHTMVKSEAFVKFIVKGIPAASAALFWLTHLFLRVSWQTSVWLYSHTATNKWNKLEQGWGNIISDTPKRIQHWVNELSDFSVPLCLAKTCLSLIFCVPPIVSTSAWYFNLLAAFLWQHDRDERVI